MRRISLHHSFIPERDDVPLMILLHSTPLGEFLLDFLFRFQRVIIRDHRITTSYNPTRGASPSGQSVFYSRIPFLVHIFRVQLITRVINTRSLNRRHHRTTEAQLQHDPTLLIGFPNWEPLCLSKLRRLTPLHSTQ